MTDLSFINALNLLDKNPGCFTGSDSVFSKGKSIDSISPVDGSLIGKVQSGDKDAYETIIAKAEEAFIKWRTVPAPERGEIIRQIGNKLRAYKDDLGRLVSFEMGKSLEEGKGEVQEMIDIADFAVGLSRQLHGLTIASERPQHRMMEQWHPLGIVGIITAFNFPVAVYAWNAFIAAVCGDVVLWKPSEKTPLCSVAVQNIIKEVLKENDLPEGIFNLVNGDYKIGELITRDKRVVLVSATGSVRMGKIVGKEVASRLGKTILELGGNNAAIVSNKARLELALKAIAFGAIGTAGQRCTSTRRIIVHKDIYQDFKQKLIEAYKQVSIGDPLDTNNLMGPLIDQDAVNTYLDALKSIKDQGGTILTDHGALEGEAFKSGCYVKPVLAEVDAELPIVKEETFAPIAYLIKYEEFEEAIHIQNNVPQGLSSCCFTDNLQESEKFLSTAGSDCGIANVNLGTSGAEIGGAFGGEKETGGGRESGSDAWKAYMRRQTNTVNYGEAIPLAQGINFNI